MGLCPGVSRRRRSAHGGFVTEAVKWIVPVFERSSRSVSDRTLPSGAPLVVRLAPATTPCATRCFGCWVRLSTRGLPVGAHRPPLRITEASPAPEETQVGPYKLLERIGEGGFGEVYMAEQTEPVRRKVAVKIIKPGMDSRRIVARFEAERQALAVMEHPNIARVFDAGATAQAAALLLPWNSFAIAITKYCDENRLTPRERLELLVPVCRPFSMHTRKASFTTTSSPAMCW